MQDKALWDTDSFENLLGAVNILVDIVAMLNGLPDKIVFPEIDGYKEFMTAVGKGQAVQFDALGGNNQALVNFTTDRGLSMEPVETFIRHAEDTLGATDGEETVATLSSHVFNIYTELKILNASVGSGLGANVEKIANDKATVKTTTDKSTRKTGNKSEALEYATKNSEFSRILAADNNRKRA